MESLKSWVAWIIFIPVSLWNVLTGRTPGPQYVYCPMCNGAKVLYSENEGKNVPCPECKGKGVVLSS